MFQNYQEYVCMNQLLLPTKINFQYGLPELIPKKNLPIINMAGAFAATHAEAIPAPNKANI